MTHLWIDPSAGIAGDMLLGALLDAGADLAAVQQAVEAVVAQSVRLRAETVTRAGLRATKAHVELAEQDPPHRTWPTIRDLLAAADLAEPLRGSAAAVFERLARAEGHVHGIDPERVHFHEVGALDSIADVVGACAAVQDLGVTSVSAGQVAVGSGRVRSAHGSMPVPVPAVAQLSIGWRITAGGEGELTTPTGMALLATLATRCEDLPSMTVRRIGVGAGSRDVAGRPNVTRVMLGDPAGSPVPPPSPATILQANVDDLDPRLWPDVLQQLLAAGADDAWLTPILMKKGRPAHTLQVLCDPFRADRLRDRMFALTSTIGVRQLEAAKVALPRIWAEVVVHGSPIQVKIAHRNGVISRVTPEFESVAARAAELGRPQQEILAAAVAAAGRAGWVVGADLPSTGPGGDGELER